MQRYQLTSMWKTWHCKHASFLLLRETVLLPSNFRYFLPPSIKISSFHCHFVMNSDIDKDCKSEGDGTKLLVCRRTDLEQMQNIYSHSNNGAVTNGQFSAFMLLHKAQGQKISNASIAYISAKHSTITLN